MNEIHRPPITDLVKALEDMGFTVVTVRNIWEDYDTPKAYQAVDLRICRKFETVEEIKKKIPVKK